MSQTFAIILIVLNAFVALLTFVGYFLKYSWYFTDFQPGNNHDDLATNFPNKYKQFFGLFDMYSDYYEDSNTNPNIYTYSYNCNNGEFYYPSRCRQSLLDSAREAALIALVTSVIPVFTFTLMAVFLGRNTNKFFNIILYFSTVGLNITYVVTAITALQKLRLFVQYVQIGGLFNGGIMGTSPGAGLIILAVILCFILLAPLTLCFFCAFISTNNSHHDTAIRYIPTIIYIPPAPQQQIQLPYPQPQPFSQPEFHSPYPTHQSNPPPAQPLIANVNSSNVFVHPIPSAPPSFPPSNAYTKSSPPMITGLPMATVVSMESAPPMPMYMQQQEEVIVQVPPGCGPGNTLEVSTPSGRKGLIQIPPGVKPGQTLTVTI